MAGQGYYNSFNSFNYQQFGLIDPELDPFNDSMSSLFDYNGYQQDGFLPPFTPPPTGNFAGVAPTPPTSSTAYTDSASSTSPPSAKRRATRSKTDPVTPRKDRSHVKRRALPTVGANGLRFANAHDAELFGLRTKVELPDEDWEDIAANPEKWVKEIMAAFDKEPIKEPSRTNKNGRAIAPATWAKFQSDHVEKTKNHIKKNPSMVEIGAWQVFQAIIDAHKLGYLDFKAESTTICSVHMTEAIKAVADYAVIRFDVVRCQGIENLASSVGATIMRKVNCCNGNSAKKEREERNAQVAAEKGISYEAVLGSGQKSNGGNNKRKRKNSE